MITLKGGPGSGNFGHEGREEESTTKTFREEDHPRVQEGPNAGQFTTKEDENPTDQPDPEEEGSTFPQLPKGMAKVGDRVWNGMPLVWDGAAPSKQAVGALGEKLAMQVLAQKTGDPFEQVDPTRNNAPIDIWGDGLAVEVKTGLATNGRSAMHWRATIGQPGKEEMAAVEKLSKEEYRKHQDWKYKQILVRKNNLLQDLNKAVPGRKLKGATVGIIMHPSLEKADVYLIEGYHLVLGWKDHATDDNFLGTYNIKRQKKAQKAVTMYDEEFPEDNGKVPTLDEFSEESIERIQAVRTPVLDFFDKDGFWSILAFSNVSGPGYTRDFILEESSKTYGKSGKTSPNFTV